MTSAPEQQTALTTTFSNIANNVVSQLAAACAATDVSITLLTGTGASFPPAPFYVSVEYEVLWCSNKTGDVLQVSRGVDGTTAAPHPANAIIQIRNNAGLFLDAYDAIHELDNGIVTGSALPANVAYTDKTQELTHKTIDLTDSSKGNVIIGTVQPDPASLPLQNIIQNGGFDEWYGNKTLTIAAGTPTSGAKQLWLTNYWWISTFNDSSITAARNATNTDPGANSGYCALVNVSTIQANDYCSLNQSTDWSFTPDSFFRKLQGQPVSASVRAKQLSGAVQIRLSFYYWDDSGQHNIEGPWVSLTSSYATYKYENQVWLPNGKIISAMFAIQFKGTGQVAVDNVFGSASSVAGSFRPTIKPMIQGKNILVNGGLEQWQRGAGPFQVSGYCADRWTLGIGGTTTVNVSKVANYGAGQWCCSYAINNIQGVAVLTQELKGADYGAIAGKFVTVTAQVLTTVPNGIQMDLYDGTNDPRSDYHPGYGSWQTLTLTTLVPQVDPSTANLQIRFLMSVNGQYYIDNVTMVIGQEPSEFIPLHPQEDLARCQRYYEQLGVTYFDPIATGAMTNATNPYILPMWKVNKVVTPTVTCIAAGWQLFDPAAQTWKTPSSVSIGGASVRGAVITPIITGATTGQAAVAVGSGNAVAITVEANP